MTSQPPPAEAQAEAPADAQPPSPAILSPAPAPAMKTYHLAYTTSRTNVRLHLDSRTGPIIYFLQTRLLTRTPSIQLHRGASKSAPMVAFARRATTSGDLLLGLGDQRGPAGELAFEELKRERKAPLRSDYEFATSVGGGGRRTYRWVKDAKQPAASVFTCVDDSGETVARMISAGAMNFNWGGEVRVVEGLEGADAGDGLEVVLVVSALAIWAAEALLYRSVVKGHE